MCLLHAYANPAHEAAAGRAAAATACRKGTYLIAFIGGPAGGMQVQCATSTTVINAYIGPVVEHYL